MAQKKIAYCTVFKNHSKSLIHDVIVSWIASKHNWSPSNFVFSIQINGLVQIQMRHFG